MLGIAAQWLAWRLHLPSILLLLVGGIVAGPVTGHLDPDALFGPLLLPLISLSVAVILFEGGLSLNLRELREIGGVVRNLVTVGVLLTWVISGLAAYLLLGIDAPLSILLGAILVVTGPTVIGPLLRHIRPEARVGNTIKWEGILNDPIGAILAVLVFEAILAGGFTGRPDFAAAAKFFSSVGMSSLCGVAGAAVFVALLHFHWVPDFLQNPFSLMMVVVVFTVSNSFQAESGLLAVTVMGITMANQKIYPVRHIIEFKENLRVLIISSLFILLGARLRASDLDAIGPAAFVFLGILILVARPAAVTVSALGSKFKKNEKLFLMWMAPRGIVAAAVASVFAERLAEAGYTAAQQLIPFTFFVIIGTVAIYGLTAFTVARRLGVAEKSPQGVLIVGAHDWARELARALREQDLRVVVVDSNWTNVRAARMAGLPAHFGGIVSESVLDQVDLYGVGRLLALTSNDEANSLAAVHFGDLFGRKEVYQLAPVSGDASERKTLSPKHLSGRFLFAPGCTYDVLSRKFAEGYTVKVTQLTAKFDYKAFQARYGQDSIPLFLINAHDHLLVFAQDVSRKPRAGQTLISLVPPQPEKPEKAAEAVREAIP